MVRLDKARLGYSGKARSGIGIFLNIILSQFQQFYSQIS
jgi:hypothetical protein